MYELEIEKLNKRKTTYWRMVDNVSVQLLRVLGVGFAF